MTHSVTTPFLHRLTSCRYQSLASQQLSPSIMRLGICQQLSPSIMGLSICQQHSHFKPCFWQTLYSFHSWIASLQFSLLVQAVTALLSSRKLPTANTCSYGKQHNCLCCFSPALCVYPVVKYRNRLSCPVLFPIDNCGIC